MTGEDSFSPVSPGDPRYATLVRAFNLRWVGQPGYVELCASATQVRDAVQRAVDDRLRITVQGGGHCYEDFAVANDGGVILDPSAMNAVYRDAETGCGTASPAARRCGPRHAVEVVVVRNGRAEIVTVARDAAGRRRPGCSCGATSVAAAATSAS